MPTFTIDRRPDTRVVAACRTCGETSGPPQPEDSYRVRRFKMTHQCKEQ